MQKKNYVQEILEIIHSGLPQAELAEKLSDYHENDLADALTALTPEERQKVYTALGVDTVAEIFSYLDDAEPYLKELDPERAARVISHMDSDDAVDALDDLEEDDKAKIANAEEEALRIINDAIKSAESKKREAWEDMQSFRSALRSVTEHEGGRYVRTFQVGEHQE